MRILYLPLSFSLNEIFHTKTACGFVFDSGALRKEEQGEAIEGLEEAEDGVGGEDL